MGLASKFPYRSWYKPKISMFSPSLSLSWPAMLPIRKTHVSGPKLSPVYEMGAISLGFHKTLERPNSMEKTNLNSESRILNSRSKGLVMTNTNIGLAIVCVFLDEELLFHQIFQRVCGPLQMWSHYITLWFSMVHAPANAISILLFILPWKSSLYS